MKKLSVSLLVCLFVGTVMVLPVLAIEGNVKTYRLGVRLGMISPTKDILTTKSTAYDLGLEFDARLNENLDTGPRFGFASVKNVQAGLDGTYSVMRFGYGARVYMMYWGEHGSTHGYANGYLNAEVDYYTANSGNVVGSLTASTMAGFGGQVGGGVEFAFGPNTGAFIEANVLRTSIKSASGEELPLDGYNLAGGVRMAFF